MFYVYIKISKILKVKRLRYMYVLDADKNVIHLWLTIHRLQVLVGFAVYRRPFVLVLHLPLVRKVTVL